MRKIIAIITLGAILVPVVALADVSAISAVLTKILTDLKTLLGVTVTIALVFAGFMFVTAGGDPSKVNMAKGAVLYALIGLTAAMLADALVKMVESWVTT